MSNNFGQVTLCEKRNRCENADRSQRTGSREWGIAGREWTIGGRMDYREAIEGVIYHSYWVQSGTHLLHTLVAFLDAQEPPRSTCNSWQMTNLTKIRWGSMDVTHLPLLFTLVKRFRILIYTIFIIYDS